MNIEVSTTVRKLLSNKETSLMKRFDIIISASNLLVTYPIESTAQNRALITNLLSEINSVRYAMAYDKGLELTTVRLDRWLAIESLRLARLIYTGSELNEYLESVLYYEADADIAAILNNEINQLKSSV